MTETTRSYIKNFIATGDIKYIPNIFLGLQEEDNISQVTEFRNCFKPLRNIAAHEPSTLVEQLRSEDNTGSNKLLFIPKKVETSFCVKMCIYQFTAWMFDLTVKLKDWDYVRFWQKFMRVLYPDATKATGIPFGTFDKARFNNSVLSLFLHWQTYAYQSRGILKNVSNYDSYMISVYKDNPKVFWKMAIPDMTNLAMFLASDDTSILSMSVLSSYLDIFKLREAID